MAAIQFACPQCGAVAEVDASQAGQEAACPACQCVLVVPAAPANLPERPASDEPSATGDRSAAPGKPSKPRLWSRPTGETARSGSRTPPPLPETIAEPGVGAPEAEEPVTESSPSPLVDLADIASGAPLSGRAGGGRAGRLAESAEQRAQRRFWANAIMFAAAAAIAFTALAVLMYLTGR